MVFVRKIKDYYVLGHSIRKGKKIFQKTKYLGKTLPPKKRLEQLKKEFLKELKGNKYKYLSEKDIVEIDRKREEEKKEQKKLSLSEKKKNFEDFLIRLYYIFK